MCDLYALAERRTAGFSLHQMIEQVDAGDIFHVEEVQADRSDDYLGYLARSAVLEGAAVARLLDATAATGQLPPTRPNRCDHPVIARTPGREELLRLRQEIKL
jgi:methionyl-tRNA formyltransferase